MHSNEIANGFRAETLRCFLKRIELYRGLELLEPCPHLELLALGGKHRRPQIEGLLTNICQTRKGKYDEHSVTAGFNFSECLHTSVSVRFIPKKSKKKVELERLVDTEKVICTNFRQQNVFVAT